MTDVIGSSRLCSRAATLTLQNGQKTIWGSCENVIFIRNAGTNPKVMVKGKRNRENLIMSLADSCFEFLRDLETDTIPTSFAAALRSLPKTSHS